MKKLKVLSLFDGMSCGQIALNKSKIKYDSYLASEVKSVAIQVTQENYPNTIQLGDITKINLDRLSPNIDLLIGGSPCQNFSLANRYTREGLKGEKSKLFFEFLKIKNHLNPRYFLLENVRMKKEDEEYISKLLGVKPIYCDSFIFSGVYRKRLYWTNIPTHYLQEEIDKRTRNFDLIPNFQDIIEDGFVSRKYGTCLLESDGRPNVNLKKLARRFFKIGFGNVVFKDYETYKKLSIDYELAQDGDIRVLNQRELETAKGVPLNYTKCLTRNESANIIGDAWQIDTIAKIFEGLKDQQEKIILT